MDMGSDAEFEAVPIDQRGVDPFNGQGQEFVVTSPVQLDQLVDELSAAMGEDVEMAAYLPVGDAGEELPVSGKSPMKMFLKCASLDGGVAKQVLSAHRPNPYYGMTEEQKRHAQLLKKARDGEELTLREQGELIRTLLV